MIEKMGTRLWLVGLVVIALVACGGSSDTADGGDSKAADDGPSPAAEATPTVAAIEPPPPTPTHEPLTKSEEQDESDYFENSGTYLEARMAPGAAIVPGRTKRLKTVTKGLFEVSVLRAGPYTISGKATGDEQYYRLDLRVENVGAETGIFEPDGLLLTDEEGNQYGLRRNASKRVLNWPIQVAPEVTFSATTAGGATLNVEIGFVLFEPIPESVGKIGFTFKLGADDFEYQLDVGGT